MRNPFRGTFRSLQTYNYRVWASGAVVSNVGTWMQRTAQDWLVLTELTDHNAQAVGIVMGLQFGPQVLMLPISGYIADNFDRRKVLLATQGAMGLLALGLGLLTVTGLVQLWHVYAFAFGLGCTAALDVPARQTFVAELVDNSLLSNAVALNSTSFNAARMVGPAVAGLLIAAVGTGWVFLLNGLSFAGVITSLCLLRKEQLHPRPPKRRANLADGFRYVFRRADLVAMMVMICIIGMIGLNFAIYISTMAVSVFGKGSGEYGVLTSIMAIGTLTGALLAAQRTRVDVDVLILSSALFGIGCILAALAPHYVLFGAALIFIGAAAQTFTTSTISLVQLGTDPGMRGRVVAILMAIFVGGTPIGGPIVGWIADHFGPRWAMGGAGGSAGILAAATGLYYMVRHRGLQVWREGWRIRARLTKELVTDNPYRTERGEANR